MLFTSGSNAEFSVIILPSASYSNEYSLIIVPSSALSMLTGDSPLSTHLYFPYQVNKIASLSFCLKYLYLHHPLSWAQFKLNYLPALILQHIPEKCPVIHYLYIFHQFQHLCYTLCLIK